MTAKNQYLNWNGKNRNLNMLHRKNIQGLYTACVLYSRLGYELERSFTLLTYVTDRIVMQDKATEMHNDRSEKQEEKNNSSVIITFSSRHFEVGM